METKLLACFVLCFLSSSCQGISIQIPANTTFPPAVFALGDSILDQGNNNLISTPIKSNFPPYGVDFSGGMPTGRFSNGKTPPDIIVEILGIKDLVPAYSKPNLQLSDLRTGVSFASGGTGYDPLTSNLAGSIPIYDQLESFNEFITKLKAMVGEEEVEGIIGNSLYFISSGANDLISYYNLRTRRLQYDIDSYTTFLVDLASNYIQEMYKLGARRMAVLSFPPVGCLPAERTLLGGVFSRECSEKLNQAATLANAKLSARLDSLTATLPQSRVVYIDIYSPFLGFIEDPERYGFRVVDRGCCGTGKIEAGIICNKLSEICGNRSEYLFWDSVHPTEIAYKLLLQLIIPRYAPKLF